MDSRLRGNDGCQSEMTDFFTDKGRNSFLNTQKTVYHTGKLFIIKSNSNKLNKYAG